MEESNHSVLKIYASSTDHVGTKLLYEYLVHEARDFGLLGATVYRGIMGYGSSSRISSSKFWELTEKLPVTIELVDHPEKLELFFKRIQPTLITMPKGCLVTIEPIDIILLKSGKKN